MTLLDFGSNGAVAFCTVKKAREGFGHEYMVFKSVSEASIDYGLHVIKQLLGNDCLMYPLIYLTAIPEMTIIHWIHQHGRNNRVPDALSSSRAHIVVAKKLSQHHVANRVRAGIRRPDVIAYTACGISDVMPHPVLCRMAGERL